MTKILLYIILIIVVFVSGIMTFRFLNHRNESYKIESIVFKSETGWGYDILVNNKIYIHQEFIPAVKGKQYFQSEMEAQKTGNLIMKKIKNKELPIIKITELDSLEIRYSVF